MKKLLTSLLLCVALLMVAPSAFADWSCGTARFTGNQPKSSMTTGTIKIFYNGTIRKTGSMGTVDIWECTGEACVVYPKNYTGRKIQVKSPKQVQYQTLK